MLLRLHGHRSPGGVGLRPRADRIAGWRAHLSRSRRQRPRGRVLDQLETLPADERHVEAADQVVDHAIRHMGRTMDTTDIRTLLYDNAEHPRWDDVASRCLSCGHCTMVCPTCFCTSAEDHTSLSGENTERWRVWDSCFTTDFSYVHGGSVRSSGKARYRQWMTHKLASWIDQFGTSGCVGCGRCLTWCPVGIDITEEVAAIRADPRPPPPEPGRGGDMRSLEQLLMEHPFFAGLDDSTVTMLVGCAANEHFRPDQYLFHEGEPADRFFVVRRGRVALDVHVPGQAEHVIDTVDEGDVVGWSWLIPPYRWFFDGRAVQDVSVIAFDATCLRGKCDQDPALGYAVMQRAAQVMYRRLQSARVRLLDLYGADRAS